MLWSDKSAVKKKLSVCLSVAESLKFSARTSACIYGVNPEDERIFSFAYKPAYQETIPHSRRAFRLRYCKCFTPILKKNPVRSHHGSGPNRLYTRYPFWLPARWPSCFSGDHQQNHQCLWFPSCYNVTHVFCHSLLAFCWQYNYYYYYCPVLICPAVGESEVEKANSF